MEQLRELITILNQTDIAELTLESGDLRLNIRKNETKVVAIAPSPMPTMVSSEIPAIAQASPTISPTTTTPPPETVPAKNLVDVTSPMVGTFYRSPAPDEPVFVENGDQIRKGQTICIIEAMKLMNELEAEVSGEVVEILLQNGDPVEYGQVLMRVNPG